MKICSKCGAPLRDDMRFCTNCGAPSEETSTSQEHTTPAQDTPQNSYQESCQAQNTYRDAYQNQGAYQNTYQESYQNQNAYQNQSFYQESYPNYSAYDTTMQYDHTAEFDEQDISDNKVICMLAYLMGTVGVIVALLVSSSSPYVAFHVRQALKFTVISILTGIVTLILCWTIIVPIAALIFLLVLFVIKIICFFQICSGKAIEPYIIRNLGFLK